jgi:hypothetical protein
VAHTRRVRRWIPVLIAGVVALSLGLAALSSFRTAGDVASALGGGSQAGPADPGEADPSTEPGDDGDEGDGRDDRDHRTGPPSWAHGHGAKAHKGSLSAWKALSPSQRASTMAKLVRAHEIGMKKFAACRAAGGDDCVRPLPPGLAKRG